MMAEVISFALLWTVSYLGYRAGRHFKVPAPAILGPVISFIFLALCGVKLSAPSWQKPILSVITGILLGIRMNHSLKGVYKQMMIYIIWLVLLSFAGIWVLIAVGVDKETAFFAAMPGGMAEITLMSLGYHSDPFVTVLLQSSRMLISMTVFSSMAERYRNADVEEKKAGLSNENSKKLSAPAWVGVCLVSLGTAKLLEWFHMPAANILGPMMVVGAAVRSGSFECKINRHFQTLVQIGIGGLTGASISKESMLQLPNYVIPVILLSLLVIGSGIVMSCIFMKVTNWDRATCLLSCCPAGLSPTIMVAMEYGADANIVTVFQVLRMVTVLIATPVMVRFLL